MKANKRYFSEGVHCHLDGRSMRVANLSTGGLFAASDEPPSIGQVVILELQLGPRDSFRVVGEVAWVNDPASPIAVNLPKGFGVRFTRIASTDKEAILTVLRRSEPVMGPSRPDEDDRRASGG